MNTVQIAKEFRWEMGHRLPFHEGHCQNIHGHSYRLRVAVEGTPDPNGMVMDFYDLSAVVEPIVDMLDHAFICDSSDEIMQRFFRDYPAFKVVYVPFTTTVENLCRWIADHLAERLRQTPTIHRLTVRLYETATAYAECTYHFAQTPSGAA
ncbi:MAG: 6-carboxytetrahydropterin synthase QueD [Bacteroidota bacterium]|nr:6-carboxytetrahydropterin synthase QueD [Candidatus Kapabacteria bacterium]MCS7302689.1 6-carboxytetrahydropterin synthase QueD [Candidatus Kapabacteria bacterium]MCX7936197.1 6-carboxytetrahydropterin synthase QueD [Chlorobiota bacterium]MDW8074909.1 6-carboxytetrahydropterin synthase QueD [Bacteroidota bacterium]MDW8271548.1 6-carboxytetrahydropterin synthase QueD [Bacteroidota bacterium]